VKQAGRVVTGTLPTRRPTESLFNYLWAGAWALTPQAKKTFATKFSLMSPPLDFKGMLRPFVFGDDSLGEQIQRLPEY
jgi:hypothetical protein